MKKLGVVAGAFILLGIVVIVVAGLWVKAHLQEITRDLTGMDIRFASVDLVYSPIPTIQLTDIALKEGNNTIQIPQLRLYPDLSNILSGEIRLTKAVLEEPLVVAAGLNPSMVKNPDAGSSSTPSISMNAIPDGIVEVNGGKLVLKANHGEALPVSVTAQAEKTDQQLSVQFNNASIEEIGLKFVGQVEIDAFVPLKLSVRASEGTFNPDAVKKFLLKFGYISGKDAERIPLIEHMAAKGLNLQFDAGSGNINLMVDALNVDRVELRDVAVKLSDGGAFQVSCADGSLDAQGIYGWLQQNADTKKMVDDMLVGAKLKQINPQGAISISALRLQGKSAASDGDAAVAPVEGVVDLNAQGLALQLVAENGEQQHLTITRLESRITMKNGKPNVQVGKFDFSSSRGGTGNISGEISFPLNRKQSILKSSINGFKIFDSTLDFQLDKSAHPKTPIKLILDSPALKVSTNGVIFIPGRQKTDLEARLVHLQIAVPSNVSASNTSTGSQKTQRNTLEEPFDTSLFSNKDITAKAFIKSFQFEGMPKLQDVDLQFRSGDEKSVLNGSFHMGGVNLNVGAVGLPSNKIAATLETKGTDVDLSALIACFSNELPVYLSGRVFLNGSFGTSGDTPQQLIDEAQGEVSVSFTQAAVQRLSALDKRLGFFLDILRTAGISSEQKDTISLNKGVVQANIQDGRIIFDRFLLTGPLLKAWGQGEYTLQNKHLMLTGSVQTALGVKRRLAIDRVLEKEEI